MTGWAAPSPTALVPARDPIRHHPIRHACSALPKVQICRAGTRMPDHVGAGRTRSGWVPASPGELSCGTLERCGSGLLALRNGEILDGAVRGLPESPDVLLVD